jgi:hypothetical protein
MENIFKLTDKTQTALTPNSLSERERGFQIQSGSPSTLVGEGLGEGFAPLREEGKGFVSQSASLTVVEPSFFSAITSFFIDIAMVSQLRTE